MFQTNTEGIIKKATSIYLINYWNIYTSKEGTGETQYIK